MSKASVLVVEDEGIVAKDLQVTLQGLGYDVPATVASGEDALVRAAEMRPDLVLMDIVLAGAMDGVQAAQALHDRLDIPVVYLTAYSDERMLQRAMRTEPFGFLVKPFEERSLVTTLEMALYKHGMEQRLRESEQWLATTLRSIGEGVIATDADGRVKFMNAVAEGLTGWTEVAALGRRLSEVFHVVDERTRAVAENPVDRTLREGVVLGLADHNMLIARDGTERPIADSGAPILGKDGRVLGVVLVFHDVTEKRKMEEELWKAQKLESVGVLAGGIAHDFNNLLTGILANIGLAKLHARPGTETHERMDEAERASLEAKSLTRQLLTFAVGGKPVRRPVSIVQLLEDSARFALRGTATSYELTTGGDLAPVELDPGQIGQVFNNLFVNAAQAMPGGGTVEVSAENVTVEPDDRLPLPGGRFVKISIQDGGIGIPRHQLTKIFDPYFTTKQKGSGLGLAVCYSIVRRHEGLITVDSELGVGTRFDVYLPSSGKQVAPVRVAREEPLAGTGRILVMDDQEIVRRAAASALLDLGYEVEQAEDGAEAVQLYQAARDAGRPFAAVILDLTVSGGMGGKEAMERLLALDPRVRAVVSSGYHDDPIMADYRSYGFRGAIAKPYSIAALADVVDVVISAGD